MWNGGDKECVLNLLGGGCGDLLEEDYQENQEVDGRITLSSSFRRHGLRMGERWNWLVLRPVA
jgi:hypothetical protein